MRRVAQYMQKGKMHHVLNVAMGGLFDNAAKDQHVAFVYDFASCSDAWESLRFVHDAGRRPLRILSDADFFEAYGIQRTLQFNRRPLREPSDEPWFNSLY